MSLEKITTQQMDAKGVCAAPDVLSGTPAQNKAVFDRMVRELIAPAYNAAVDAINEINQTENGIEAAEALRVSAENLRVAAENARAQAEGGRVTAEQARASAENLRVEAENLRKAAETARSKAESGRVTADKDRESAETTRVVNENQRIENENARIAAEHARADENTGIVAQATKKADEAAESARLAAQAMLGQIPDGSFPESKLVSELQEAIDRAKPGGEIDRTSANNDPRKWGLGTSAVNPPNNSLDDAVKNGWYTCSPSFNGAPTGHSLIGYGTVLAIERASDCCIQVYWSEAASNIAGSPLNLVRKYDGTTWSPWEWVNPPMFIGVEYRTTERYLGKPVYVRLHDFGALPNSTFKEDSSPASWSIDKAICAYGTTSDGITIPTNNYAGMIADGRRISMYFMRTEITIATDANRTNTSATIFLKYTKTTD